jgi:hypothetical protein
VIQARPTIYRGVQMRSRLEARMAQHLDELGWGWDYEPIAFGSEQGQYLPDFALYDEPGKYVMYVEVKPTVDYAERVMSRMEIIWESDPDAQLGIWTGDGAVFLTNRKRDWSRVPKSDLNLVPVAHAVPGSEDELLLENRRLRQELDELTIRRLREDAGRE